MRTKWKVLLVVTFLAGVIAGNIISGTPETEYEVITETKTITETETVEVPTTPAECTEAIRLAKQYADAASEFDLTTSDLLQIIAELRIALADQNGNEATLLENQVRDIQAVTVGAAETLGKNYETFDENADACLEGIQ